MTDALEPKYAPPTPPIIIRMAVRIMATAIAAMKGTLSESDVMRPQRSYSQRMKAGAFSASPLTP